MWCYVPHIKSYRVLILFQIFKFQQAGIALWCWCICMYIGEYCIISDIITLVCFRQDSPDGLDQTFKMKIWNRKLGNEIEMGNYDTVH